MIRLKSILAALFYLASLAALFSTHVLLATVVSLYSLSYPTTFGPRVTAFSSLAMQLAGNSAFVCAVAGLVSAGLLALSLRRATSGDARRYWTVVLAVINYHVSVFTLGTVLMGFFVLPRLANGG